VHAQVTNIVGTVNRYAAVTNISGSTLTLSGPFTAAPGDWILIIQMRGGTVSLANDTLLYGSYSNLASAGNYELKQIQSATPPSLTVSGAMQRTYDSNFGVQVVWVPRYVFANTIGPVTGQVWNGTIGGIIAIMADSAITLNHNIDAIGIGFRGGLRSTNYTNGSQSQANCPFFGLTYTSASGFAGHKGEGIVPPRCAQ
jgi:hypothetical protein